MQIQWLFLALAIGLLWPPMPMGSSLRRYVLRSRRNASATVRWMCELWQNWVDLIRAIGGAYVLAELALSADPTVEGAATRVLMWQGCILGVGVLAQTVRFDDQIRIIAPLFYATGLTLILPGSIIGGFAGFTGWLFAIGCKSPNYLLPITVVALGAAGYVLGGLDLALILNCVLIAVPMALAFMFRQPLLFVAREPNRLPVNV